MSDQIPMRSASERRDAAAKALADYERSQPNDYERAYADPLAAALRPLLEVPEVGLTEREIIDKSIGRTLAGLDLGDGVKPTIANLCRAISSGWLDEIALEVLLRSVAQAAVQRAERAALEHWEPADVPSQEFMLRHLGIIHRPIPENGRIGIPAQSIEKEVF